MTAPRLRSLQLRLAVRLAALFIVGSAALIGVLVWRASEVDEASPIPNHLTRPANYLDLCSLAMPSGFSAGLPLGVQIIGKPFAEGTVLRLGKAYQDATDFHRQAPDLSALGL